MDSTGPTTAIIRCNLGTAAAFDQTVFPVGYYEAGSNFGKACFLLEATVDEMATIAQLGIDLNKNDGFIFGTRVKVDESVLVHAPHTFANVNSLRERKAKIEGNRKTINPIKVFRNITGKDAREFHTVSRSVFLETKVRLQNTHFTIFTECPRLAYVGEDPERGWAFARGSKHTGSDNRW